jgi:hypothetical protein
MSQFKFKYDIKVENIIECIKIDSLDLYFDRDKIHHHNDRSIALSTLPDDLPESLQTTSTIHQHHMRNKKKQRLISDYDDEEQKRMTIQRLEQEKKIQMEKDHLDFGMTENISIDQIKISLQANPDLLANPPPKINENHSNDHPPTITRNHTQPNLNDQQQFTDHHTKSLDINQDYQSALYEAITLKIKVKKPKFMMKCSCFYAFQFHYQWFVT